MDILYLTEHEKIVDADYTGSSSVELLRELQDTLNRLRGALHFALMVSILVPTTICVAGSPITAAMPSISGHALAAAA
jgi:hypothetical protein